ncbi:hypothetical protein BDN72DRAFT_485439 [Pluteus cervinus]|uniref:Uncharacterized protein n=1 Tax=Pluteus cervinus TaxID=181527 RepID=A0ACD3A5Q7_9AGAR|nr:hypothetical protein BDN72DRAFT_485439 [Pluteus cervinus]
MLGVYALRQSPRGLHAMTSETPPPTQKKNQATTSDTLSRGRARSPSVSSFTQAPSSARSRSVGRSAHADYYGSLAQRRTKGKRPTCSAPNSPPAEPPMQLALPTFVLHPQPEPESNSEDDGDILIAVQAASPGEYPVSPVVDSYLPFSTLDPSGSFSSSNSSRTSLLSVSVFSTRSMLSMVSPATTTEAAPSYELNDTTATKSLIQAQAPLMSRCASTSALDSLKLCEGSRKRHDISTTTWGHKSLIGLPAALFGSNNTALDTSVAGPEQAAPAISIGAETQLTKRHRAGSFVGGSLQTLKSGFKGLRRMISRTNIKS